MKSFLVFLLISLNIAFAQTYRPAITSPNGIEPKTATPAIVKVCAVMVEFQLDNDGTTYGNGKFNSIYSENYGSEIIDPLPHDKTYFETHLEFAKNYFNKVSKGKTQIEYTVLPNTITVDKTMKNYSPPINSTDFKPIGELAAEVWRKADSAHAGFNFSQYDLFAIFHAGVGRDVSLPGSLGNERDIPSLYLSFQKLKDFFGASFGGFPVSSNNFFIGNSMILPQTESREQSSLGGKALYEISINGLIVSSIASYLGLPDLFDTKTGLSAIGRFGLMDGQSIFAYNGLFPPELSAWEKIYLGWETPIEISNYDGNLNIVASAVSGLSDTTILKIPINNQEYFLVENRQRDALSNGAKVVVVNNGIQRTISFPKDTTGFYSYDIRALDGVVINVDEFDWALPGNGIVIWHIDENIIKENIFSNTINANSSSRGVDVEEADGIQDIGVEFQTIFGDILVGEGTEEDFWFAGNDADLFLNKFNANTRPNSRANNDANSLISLNNFSSISNKMSFNFSRRDSIISINFSSAPLPKYSSEIQLGIVPEKNQNVNDLIRAKYLLAGLNDNLYRYNLNGQLIDSTVNFGKFAGYSFPSYSIVAGVFKNSLNVNVFADTGNASYAFALPDTATSLAIKKHLNEETSIYIGTSNGRILKYSLVNILGGQLNLTKVDSLNSGGKIAAMIVYEDELIAAQDFSNGKLGIVSAIAGKFYETNYFPPVYLHGDADKRILLSSINYSRLLVNRQLSDVNMTSNFPILLDLKRNGAAYAIEMNGQLKATDIYGTSAENFPIEFPFAADQGVILSADIIGGDDAEVLALTDGRLYAFDAISGNVSPEFPIIADLYLPFPNYHALYSSNGTNLNYFYLDKDYKLQSIKLTDSKGKVYWTSAASNYSGNSIIPNVQTINQRADFLPKSLTYNYPNPVYGKSTNIRYFVNENASIKIRIFDLAGDFVAELSDNAIGGIDNETIWDVSSIQSGVYLASVEATGASGRTETNIIKIAIVK